MASLYLKFVDKNTEDKIKEEYKCFLTGKEEIKFVSEEDIKELNLRDKLNINENYKYIIITDKRIVYIYDREYVDAESSNSDSIGVTRRVVKGRNDTTTRELEVKSETLSKIVSKVDICINPVNEKDWSHIDLGDIILKLDDVEKAKELYRFFCEYLYNQ